MKAVCRICPHGCELEEGQVGICRARVAVEGRVVSQNYGRVTSLQLDPIGKKPLARFYPGSRILSVGSYGCNMSCPFCQNHLISQADYMDVETMQVFPVDLVQHAEMMTRQGNIGVAFTYNEPLVGPEYVLDSCRLLHQADMKTVVVTNGMVNPEPMKELLPFIDAMNIDLKGFSQDFYTRCGGNLQAVKDTIALCAGSCHVEVTTLVVPGMNDSLEEISQIASWLQSVNPDIVLHITRFFPNYRMKDVEPTDVDLLKKMKVVAGAHLRYVFLGNV